MALAFCDRLMVGSGGDTYDPICDLVSGHKGGCRSTAAIDQHAFTFKCVVCGAEGHDRRQFAWEKIAGELVGLCASGA